MRIVDRLNSTEPCFSFEFFPPHTAEGVNSLFRTVIELSPLQPAYVSVTYPGSSTPDPDAEIRRRRELTLELTRRIREESGIEAMAHITCSGHTRDDLVQLLDRLAEEGAENVLALRGDPPGGTGTFVKHRDGFEHAVELISLIRDRGYDFCVGAACYPETHVECEDPDQDIRNLKAKVDAGADFLVSQLFHDNRCWKDFMSRVRAAGIGQASRRASGGSWTPAATTRTRWSRSGWRIPPPRRSSCSTRESPGSTSTRSTGRGRPARSSAQSAPTAVAVEAARICPLTRGFKSLAPR